MLDALIPFSFVILLAMWTVWYLFGRRRPARPQLSANYRQSVLRSLNLLRDVGVVGNGEVDDDLFLSSSNGRRLAVLSFEGSYWDAGLVFTHVDADGFDRLNQSLDRDQVQLRWL